MAAHRGSYPPEAHELDTEVDRRVLGLKSYLASQQQSFSPEHPRYQAAEALSRVLFPDGVVSIIRLSYVQEYETVDTLLRQLHSEALKAHLDALPELSSILRLR